MVGMFVGNKNGTKAFGGQFSGFHAALNFDPRKTGVHKDGSGAVRDINRIAFAAAGQNTDARVT